MRDFDDPSTWDIQDYNLFIKLSKYPRMESTGVPDIHGVEIFEDDIVKYRIKEKFNDEEELETGDLDDEDTYEQISRIIYKDGRFSPLPYKDVCEDSWYSNKAYHFEIIGNLYETPELIP